MPKSFPPVALSPKENKHFFFLWIAVLALWIKNTLFLVATQAPFDSLFFCFLTYAAGGLFLTSAGFLFLSWKKPLFFGYAWITVGILFTAEFVSSVYADFTGEPYCGFEVVEYALVSPSASYEIVLDLFKNQSFLILFSVSAFFWGILFFLSYFFAKSLSNRGFLFSKVPTPKINLVLVLLVGTSIFGLAESARRYAIYPGFLGGLWVDLLERAEQPSFAAQALNLDKPVRLRPKIFPEPQSTPFTLIKTSAKQPKKML
jgi:hypothetical protein